MMKSTYPLSELNTFIQRHSQYGLYVATLLAQNPLTLAFEVAMERNREVVALVPVLPDPRRVADHLSRDLGLPLGAD